MGISTIVTSGKGGVGKSVFSVGLGRALAKKGNQVLLIDGDAGLRCLDKMTGAEENILFDISDVMYGRCAPIDAIYPCKDSQGLFLMPAPISVNSRVTPAVMKQLLPVLKRHYDYVILDCPAGLGAGFEASACCADRAVVVCNADPVCLRGINAVRRALDEHGVSDKMLVINRFQQDFFMETAVFEDLDDVIDMAALQLLGLVPEDYTLASAFLNGKAAPESTSGMMAMSRIAARFEGDMVPLDL